MISTPSSSEGVKHIPRNSCPHCPASQNFPTQLLLGVVLSRFGLFPKAQHPSCCQETTPDIPFILPSSPLDIIDSLATEGVPGKGSLESRGVVVKRPLIHRESLGWQHHRKRH